jgi:single-stranded DNA-binding protein
MNSFVLQATVCKDPEMRYLPDGKKQMCRWKVEGKESRKDSPPFELVCSAYGDLADAVFNKFKVGHQLTLEGRLQMNLVETNGTKKKVPELICNRIHDSYEMPF